MEGRRHGGEDIRLGRTCQAGEPGLGEAQGRSREEGVKELGKGAGRG